MPDFDKDIELKKLDLVRDEVRTSYYTMMGAYLSTIIVILGATIGVGLTVASPLVWLIVLWLMVLFVLALLTERPANTRNTLSGWRRS